MTDRQKTHTLDGNPAIEVLIRRSARARRFSLRVSRSDGQVSLSLPNWAAEAEALDFLTSREDWLRRHVAATPDVQRPMIGGAIPICGTLRPIEAGAGRAARFDGGVVRVPDDARLAPRVGALLRAMARERLVAAAGKYAAELGRPHGRVTLRDTRSRWGSCTTKGDLMFSWRLIMAPPAILDYVAAHEVAHLMEMNHSDRFWRLCAQLCPDYATHRAWLRREGPGLLAWRFDAEVESAP